jgi:hypothetical protein
LLAFVLLSARDGIPIAHEELARATEHAETCLPFVPDSQLSWMNRTQTLAVLGWQALTENAGVGSHWHVDPDGGLTLFAGHCWPRETGWSFGSDESWASQLASWLEANSIATAHEQLFGLYAALRLDPDGAGMATTDLLGGGVLYHAENARWFALSNRASLAAAAADGFEGVPERDPLAMGWLVFWDSTLADDSGYWDATRLPFDGQIVFGPGGAARIEKRASPFWHRPGPNPTAGDYATQLDELDADLRATLRVIATLPVSDFELRLSGGKDSRMLAALLHDEGLADRFRFFSYGLPGQADVLGAELVARRLGLEWEFEARTGIPPEQEERRLQRHAFLVEGFTNGWDNTGILLPQWGVSLSGIGGECTTFGPTATAGLAAKSIEDVKALYAVKDNFDEFDLLLPSVRRHFHRVVDDWIDAQAADGNEPSRISSLFITQQRTRCWAGPSLAVKSNLWLGPFLIPSYVRFRQLLPAHDRANPRVHIDMLRRCRVDLATIPLVNEQWREAAIAPYPDADQLRAIEPLRNQPGRPTGWRTASFDALRPMLRSYLDDRANPIFEVVDFDATQHLLARPRIDGPRLRALYGVATGAIWLGGHEQPVPLNRPWRD